jgi:hypothetical protein
VTDLWRAIDLRRCRAKCSPSLVMRRLAAETLDDFRNELSLDVLIAVDERFSTTRVSAENLD